MNKEFKEHVMQLFHSSRLIANNSHNKISSPSSTIKVDDNNSTNNDISKLNIKIRKENARKKHLNNSINNNDINKKEKLLLCDFDFNIFHDEFINNKDDIMIDAVDNGVGYFVVPGVTIDDSLKSLSLSITNPMILSTAGIHPYHVNEIVCNEESINTLSNLVNRNECLAVGECGLDYSEGFPSKELQLKWFEEQIKLSLIVNKPLFLHIRGDGATSDFINLWEKNTQKHGNDIKIVDNNNNSPQCCVHCFTGTTEELKMYLNHGFLIGLTGYIFAMDKILLKDWLNLITIDRLVIETDAPYMGWKGCRINQESKKGSKYPNIPSSLPLIANYISEISHIPINNVIKQTTINALKFLRKI